MTIRRDGEYTVRAGLSDGRDARAVVTVSDAADEAAVVGIRDGAVTVTEGVR